MHTPILHPTGAASRQLRVRPLRFVQRHVDRRFALFRIGSSNLYSRRSPLGPTMRVCVQELIEKGPLACVLYSDAGGEVEMDRGWLKAMPGYEAVGVQNHAALHVPRIQGDPDVVKSSSYVPKTREAIRSGSTRVTEHRTPVP